MKRDENGRICSGYRCCSRGEQFTFLDSVLKRQMRRVSDEEFYHKWLRFYFDHVPERVVFRLVVQTTKEDFRGAEYWGGMHHRANSCGDGAWPIEMYLAGIDR
jgi:hypothetical protein